MKELYIWDNSIKIKTKYGYKTELELFELYRNYLFALGERQEFGDLYGDTEQLIEMYEDRLEKAKVKVKK